MWSVWPETVDLYLGQGLAMLQRGRTPATVVQPESAVQLPQLLAQVRGQLPKRCQLRITLSGALCPAIAIQMPEDVHRYAEVMAIAEATAAQSMGIAADQLLSEIPRQGVPVVAAIPKALLGTLQAWATQERMKIRSMRPLWSVATQCAAVQSPSVRALVLQEPDATTLLANTADGAWQASSLPRTVVSTSADSARRRWQVGLGLADKDVYALSFTATENLGQKPSGSPDCWPAHWVAP